MYEKEEKCVEQFITGNAHSPFYYFYCLFACLTFVFNTDVPHPLSWNPTLTKRFRFFSRGWGAFPDSLVQVLFSFALGSNCVPFLK